MIGSSTLFIKNNDKYEAHIFGGFFTHDFLNDALKRKISPFKSMEINTRKWGKAEVEDISFEEIIQVLKSRSINPKDKNYHKLCGDGIYLLDKDSKKLYSQKFVGRERQAEFEEMTPIQEKIRVYSIPEGYKKRNNNSKIQDSDLILHPEFDCLQPVYQYEPKMVGKKYIKNNQRPVFRQVWKYDETYDSWLKGYFKRQIKKYKKENFSNISQNNP